MSHLARMQTLPTFEEQSLIFKKRKWLPLYLNWQLLFEITYLDSLMVHCLYRDYEKKTSVDVFWRNLTLCLFILSSWNSEIKTSRNIALPKSQNQILRAETKHD